MISNTLMLVLLGFYIVLAIAAVYEGKHLLMLYWIGAAVLNFAVLEMSLK